MSAVRRYMDALRHHRHLTQAADGEQRRYPVRQAAAVLTQRRRELLADLRRRVYG